MPWTESDAESKTHLAITPRLRSMWASIANSSLEKHGDEARAIKEANSAVHAEAMKRKSRV